MQDTWRDNPCLYDIRTLKVRVKDRHGPALGERAFHVNQVWNYCNDLSLRVLQREHRFISQVELATYTAGSSKEMPLHSQTIQAVGEEYITRRKQFKKAKLNWRVSDTDSPKYSLGWIPFKACALKYRSGQVWFSGMDKPIGLFDSYGLGSYADENGELGTGCFTQDARGHWFLCIQVKIPKGPHIRSDKILGIDLGSKTAATCSNGKKFHAKFFHALEDKLAIAQRANKKDRARAIHAKMKNQRLDALHKFTTELANQYGAIFVGNISSQWQIAAGNGKSVLDAGWGILKTQLLYKCEHAGSWAEITNESYTTQDCSACNARTGPKGPDELNVRTWTCPVCKTEHDRDINAAQNIAFKGLHGVEDRVTAARLKKDKAIAKSLERKTKLATNKTEKAKARAVARAEADEVAHGLVRPVVGILVL